MRLFESVITTSMPSAVDAIPFGRSNEAESDVPSAEPADVPEPAIVVTVRDESSI